MLTYFDDGSKDGGVVDDAAVPASVTELILALVDGDPRTATHPGHVILVQVAQLGLTGSQSWSLAAWLRLQRLLQQPHVSVTTRRT